MKKFLISFFFIIISTSISNANPISNCQINQSLLQFDDSQKIILASVTCFYSGEKTSGMNKICYYDCLGSEAAITVGAAELCPLSIQN